MKITTWNVNSVAARLPRLLSFLEREKPDVLALQEIKTEEAKFPLAPLQELGYKIAVSGQKTYNGVATLCKSEFPVLKMESIVLEPFAADARCLKLSLDGFQIVNVYVPNGQTVGHPKYVSKLAWLENLKLLCQNWLLEGELVLLGDFNVTPEDRDVHDPDLWHEKILCSTPERERLHALFALGLKDLFRLHSNEGGIYSWWDYRQLAFVRNQGLRIDLILGSLGIQQRCKYVTHHREERKGEKPSDHVPVTLTL